MTVKELEELVGMTRANIRFYEQEGLLSPARLENGYRDYSEADADTLRKIKLLRQLHLDLNAIRALQSGEQELTQALAAQLTALEHDRQALERVNEVCRALGSSGVSFAALDPKPWLEALEREPVPESRHFAPEADARLSDSVCHPWARFLAREIDLSLYSLLWGAVWMLLLRWDLGSTLVGKLFNSYVCYALMLLIEPLLLHLCGATLGKLVFGISVRDADGAKLSWGAALERTWNMFASGMGYGIPFYSWWRYWKSYKACADEECCPWEGEERYTVASPNGWNIGFCALFFLVDLLLAYNIARWSMLPPNRGDLTTAEYFENVNYYMDELELSPYVRPDENGVWVDNTPPDVFVYLSEATYTYDVTLADGFVTGVTLTYTSSDEQAIFLNSVQAQVTLLALVSAQKGFDVETMDDWASEAAREAWHFDVTRDGIRISCTTEIANIDFNGLDPDVYRSFLAAEEGKTAEVTRVFHISLEETS